MPLSPDQGSTAGGTTVTLTGTDLATTDHVVIGPDAVHAGGPNASFTVISDTEITAVPPPQTAGPADIIVVATGGRFSCRRATPTRQGPTSDSPPPCQWPPVRARTR